MAITLNGTTGIVTADGSAGAPGLKGTDADSGVSFAADSIKFSTGGTERIAVSNTSYPRILQVESTTKQDVYSQAGDSSSWTAVTGLSASITPTKATNEILIQVQIYSSNDSNDYANAFRLYKAGAHLTGASGTGAGNRDGAFLAHRQGDQGVDPYSLSNSYLDTAGGTSAITYQLYMKVENNSNGYINRTGNDSDHWYSARGSSTITVMEVAI